MNLNNFAEINSTGTGPLTGFSLFLFLLTSTVGKVINASRLNANSVDSSITQNSMLSKFNAWDLKLTITNSLVSLIDSLANNVAPEK